MMSLNLKMKKRRKMIKAVTAEIKQFLINLDLEKLIEVNLTIEEFIFLSLIDAKKSDLYQQYTSQFKTSILQNAKQITSLLERELITQEIPNNYLFNNFKITEKFYQLFMNDKTQIIKDIKDTYPKQTPSGKRKGLQASQAKWIPKYLNIVKNNMKLHQLIIDCIKFEVADREANGQMEYMPLLSTYINERRWETYEEDVVKLLEKGEIIEQVNNNNVDDI